MPFLRGQQVNSGHSISLLEDVSYHNEAFIDHEYTNGLYTKRDDMLPPLTSTFETNRSAPPQDMLPILVLPEKTSVNISSSALTNGKGFAKSVSFKDEEGMAKDSLPKNEGQIAVVCNQIETRADILIPVVQQETFTIATEVENPAEKGDSCWSNPSVGPREEYIITQGNTNEDDEDENDPYKNMASVIYSSDDEDTADDEPNDLRHYYKHGRNQFTVEHIKTIGLQTEDSDESHA